MATSGWGTCACSGPPNHASAAVSAESATLMSARLKACGLKPVFTSVWFDWYRTNASEPYFVKEPKVTSDGAEINGGMRYLAKTNGERNNLYERIFVTASPFYEETLPTIANPPSLRQEEGKQDRQRDKQMGLQHEEPTGSVIGLVLRVHKTLGAGFLELVEPPRQHFLASWLP